METGKRKRRRFFDTAVVGGLVVAIGGLCLLRLNRANPNTLLIEAVKRNDTLGVREALRRGANPNTHDVSSGGAFAQLVGYRSPGHYGASALMLALTRFEERPNLLTTTPNTEENIPLMTALLDAGAKPDDGGSDPLGGTPLTTAVTARKSKTVRLLLAHGANVNFSRMGNEPPLLRAASMGDSATIRLLIEHGADVQNRGFLGETALMCAVRNSYNPDCARILLDAGADVNAHDRQNRTVLVWAQAMQWSSNAVKAQKRRAIKNEIISILAKAGAKP